MTTWAKKDYYRPDEVAIYFSINRRTVYRWIETGKIEAVKVGKMLRVPREALENIIIKETDQ
ncbi:MAG TPA: helix-turn-helix domain-containing protein [Syntrophorhabdaceae bacterium]|jgi:excisionase family DNA binding protein|nr:helix-turn-helix domain-containing protein [Syntrophorhabdaceae bacterium]